MHHPHFRIHWYTHPCSPSLSPVTLLEVCVQCYSFIDVFFQKKTRLQSFYILCSCTIKCMSNKIHILLLYFYIFLYKNTNQHVAASHSVFEGLFYSLIVASKAGQGRTLTHLTPSPPSRHVGRRESSIKQCLVQQFSVFQQLFL